MRRLRLSPMAERTPLSQYYRESRGRLSEFVRFHRGSDETPVPATPGWTVHDVIAHLTGVAEDLAAGTPPSGGPTSEWTAGHLARGAGLSTEALLQAWAGVSPAVDPLWTRASGHRSWMPSRMSTMCARLWMTRRGATANSSVSQPKCSWAR